jgi:quinol monooxygenase YgiN
VPLFGRLFLGMIMALSAAQAQAQQTPAPNQSAPPSGPIYCVTYFEVAPSALDSTAGLLRQFAAATGKENGNVEFLALHEIGRPSRFAFVEAWRDKAALDAHGAAMQALGDKLQAAFIAPFDARRFWTLAVAAPAGGVAVAPAGAMYVLTHVDVFPAGKDQVAAMVKQLAEDSRKDGGAIRFDAVVWDGHPNHFHLIEAWANRAAFDAHVQTAHTREFRAKLVPFEGALYDERLYEPVR